MVLYDNEEPVATCRIFEEAVGTGRQSILLTPGLLD